MSCGARNSITSPSAPITSKHKHIPCKLYQDLLNIKTHYCRILEDINLSKNDDCFTKDRIQKSAQKLSKSQLVDHLSDILCSLKAICLDEYYSDNVPEEYKTIKTEAIEEDKPESLNSPSFYNCSDELSTSANNIFTEYNIMKTKEPDKISDMSEDQTDTQPSRSTEVEECCSDLIQYDNCIPEEFRHREKAIKSEVVEEEVKSKLVTSAFGNDIFVEYNEELLNSQLLLPNSKRHCSSTKTKTVQDVKYFQQFLDEIKGIRNQSMESLTEEELINHMCEFFSGIRKKTDGSEYEPTSLWSIYASLKRHLNEKQYMFSGNQQAPAALSRVTDVLRTVSRELKKKGLGKLAHKADSLTAEEIQKLFDTGIAGYHNPLALNNAMLIHCMFLGFRGSSELYSRCLGDLKIVSQNGTRFLTIAKECVVKTRNVELFKDTSSAHGLPKLAEADGRSCPVKAYECLLKQRPSKFQSEDSPMFIRPAAIYPVQNFPVIGSKWFYDSRVGINQLGNMVRQMIKNSDIDTAGRHITNTSFRAVGKVWHLMNYNQSEG